MSAFLEARHYVVVGGEAMYVVFGLEWFHQDGVGVYVTGHHGVVFAAAGANWETHNVILVELADRLHLNE